MDKTIKAIIVLVWIRMKMLVFVFSSFFFLFFFFFFIETRISFLFCLLVHYSHQQNKRWTVHASGSRALFMGPTNLTFQQLFH